MKYILCLFLMFFIGCSHGRVSLVDLDLRTPEQIQAHKTEQKVEFETKTNPVLNIVKFVKGRLRILSVEWNND